MLFVIQFEDVYADQPARLPEREQNLAFLARHGSQVIAAGALRPHPDATPSGGICLVLAEDTAGAEALLRQDPFWIASLRKSVQVSHWAKAFWCQPFAACMEALGAG